LNESPKTYFIQTLGCNKNTVDSEILIALLNSRGYRRINTPGQADRIIVNTCAFIDDAKREAVDAILKLSASKKENARLFVTGCFAQAYAREIYEELPEVDGIGGAGDLNAVIEAIEPKPGQRDFPQTRTVSPDYSQAVQRTELLSNRGYAYIKISEGCSRSCSFCLIPHIRGGLRSRSLDEIVRESIYLEEKGVTELIITSQDTLSYGRDLHMQHGLRDLLKSLLEATEIPMIRLLYLRPDREIFDFLDTMKGGRVLTYFDIPIQHVSAKILKDMGREGNAAAYENLIHEIRACIPDAVFRTTVITGFPGEGEREFGELLDFIKRVRFHHLGVFTFSPQRETEAYKMQERVSRSKAENRKRIILETQRTVSHDLLRGEIGKTVNVLVEERVQGQDMYFGRSHHFAPEVDGLFVLHSWRDHRPGSIVRATTTAAEDYDLHGREIV
jgi:ribosomal protein S12 methylthiotransferase